MIMNLPSFFQQIQLKNGIPAQVQLLTKADKKTLADGFERLSERTRYNRFFSHVRKLSEKQLEYFTNIDYINHFALGIYDILMGPQYGIAIGRYIKMPNEPDTAEIAITVTDEYHHQGIGKYLINNLVQVARDNGFKKFVGFTLPDNKKVMKLVEVFKPKMTYQPGTIFRLDWKL